MVFKVLPGELNWIKQRFDFIFLVKMGIWWKQLRAFDFLTCGVLWSNRLWLDTFEVEHFVSPRTRRARTEKISLPGWRKKKKSWMHWYGGLACGRDLHFKYLIIRKILLKRDKIRRMKRHGFAVQFHDRKTIFSSVTWRGSLAKIDHLPVSLPLCVKIRRSFWHFRITCWVDYWSSTLVPKSQTLLTNDHHCPTSRTT